MTEVNGELLASLFQAMEEDKQDVRLFRLLSKTITKVEATGNDAFTLTFINGVRVTLIYIFDHYLMIISDVSMYENNDTPSTKLSGDRVLYYLSQIANYRY